MSTPSTTTESPPRVRWLLLAGLALVLIPLNVYFIVQVEVVWASMQATILSLFFNVVTTLVLVLALNRLLARLAPRAALSRPELGLVYVTVSVGTSLFGVDMLQIFIGLISHPYWFADATNRWETLFFRHLPPSLVVTDREALKPLYEGHSTLFLDSHLRAWARPVLVWGLFLGALLSSFLCLASVLRRPWSDFERLTFPVVQLPLAMTREVGFWHNRGLWVGILLAGLWNVLQALHELYPSVPAPPRKVDVGPLIVNRPWSAIGWTPVGFYPFAVGLGYLMPLDLVFSCWVFYLFWKGQLVFREVMGWQPLSGMYMGMQSSGAWVGLGIMASWALRGHFRRLLRLALGSASPIDRQALPSTEALSARAALAGWLVSVLALAGFGRALGAAWSTMLAFWGIYFLLVFAVARMRAELGPPTHDLARGGPDQLLPALLGAASFSPRELTLFTLSDWYNYSYRPHPIAHQLEGLKIAEVSHASLRKTLALMAWAMLVAYFAWLLISLDTVYRQGFSAKILSYLDDAANQSWSQLAQWLTSEGDPDFAGRLQFTLGLLFTIGLLLLRKTWLFFPLHPVGYAVAGCWTMSWLWFSLLLAWLVKLLLVRYGGLAAYRRGRFFFFGLLLGDHVVGGGLCLLGALLGRPVRGFFP